MSEGNVNEQDLPLLESSEISTTHELPTVWCCMLVMVLISMSYAFSEAPLYRLYESRICVGYWLEHDSTVIDSHGNVPEDKCKLPFIQTDLAMFQSNQVLYNTITSFLATLYTAPVGKMCGRRLVLNLNIASHLCAQIWIYIFLYIRTYSLNLTLISSIFLLIASGPEMRQETIFMVIADAIPIEHSFTFFTLGQLVVLAPAFVAKQLASVLMRITIWIPLGISITLWAAIFLITFLMPIKAVREGINAADREHPELNTSEIEINTNIKLNIEPIIRTLSSVFVSPVVSILLLTFIPTSAYGQLMSGPVFLQYVELRLGMDLAEASRVQANGDLMNLVCQLLSVVLFGKLRDLALVLFGDRFKHCALFLTRCTTRIQMQNITLSWCYAIFSTIGFIVMGLSPNYGILLLGLLFCAVGQPFRMAVRSTIIHIASKSSKDRVTGPFAIITFMDLLGGWLINLILAKSLAMGIRIGGLLLGLPLLVAACIWGLVSVIVISVSVFLARGESEVVNDL